MKNLFRILAAVYVTMAATACVEEKISSVDTEKFNVEINANLTHDTRTLIGDLTDGIYPFTWENTDELAILENVNGAKSQVVKATVKELSDDAKSASFSTTLGSRSGSTFDYYAYYPYSAYLNGELTIPSAQTQRASSVDPVSALMYASSTGFSQQNSNLEFMFGHISAYARMTVTGLSTVDGAAVKEVRFTVNNKELAGTFTCSDSEYSVKEGYSTIISDVAALQYSDKADFDVWFSTIPVDEIAEFTVEVVTPLYIYSKTFTSGRHFGLEQGVVSNFTVNMKNAETQLRTTLNNEIHYISSDGKIVEPNPSYYADGITFGDGVSIVSNTYEDGEGIIVCNAPITSIGVRAFYSRSTLKNIILPETVTEIRDYAFDSSGITEITLPEAVTTIDTYAFNKCSSLTDVKMGNNVKQIGDLAFFQCRKLANINFSEKLEKISDNAFSYCGLSEIVLPNSLKTIGKYAFDHCTDFTELVIPESVETVATCAFEYCEGLQTLTVNGGALELYSFWYCKNLVTATIGGKTSSIGDSAFSNCTNLTDVTIGNSVTYLGSGAFWNCTSLKNISIGNGITELSGEIFHSCRNLKNIEWGTGLTRIDGTVFRGCSALTEITIPDTVTTIKAVILNCVFNDCANLKSITFGRNVTTISQLAMDCPSLKTLYFNMDTPCAISLPNTITTVYVPRNSLEAYKTAWSNYADMIYPM